MCLSFLHSILSPPCSHPPLSPLSTPSITACGHEIFYRCELADLVRFGLVGVCVRKVCVPADLETCQCLTVSNKGAGIVPFSHLISHPHPHHHPLISGSEWVISLPFYSFRGYRAAGAYPPPLPIIRQKP